MRKILSVIMLLVISSSLSFGQHVTQKPIKFTGIDQNTSQSMDKYFDKNVNSPKSVIWSSDLSDTTVWKAVNDPAATLATKWAWVQDTAHASVQFRKYVHPDLYMKSATESNGLFYFDAITNLVNATYGYENSTLTSNAISTTGHNAVMLKFYQLYKSFNDDTTMIEISNDSSTWHQILANPTITYGHANSYASGIVQYNITNYAANQTHIWIRFRFIAPATTASGQQYSGGYGWMIDDVSLEDAPNNFIDFGELWGGFAALATPLWSGYTQIPSGQTYPVCMMASFTNNGGLTQSNVVLHGKDISNGATATSLVLATQTVAHLDTLEVDNIDTIGSVIGTHNYTLYLSSDSITSTYYKDTLTVNVNDHVNGVYSRDNDYYNGYRRYNGIATTGGSVNAFQMANLVEITTADPIWAKSISFVIGSGTTLNAPIKAILYSGFGQSKTVIAESDYHFIAANEIATTVASAPPAIELYFTDYTNAKLQKDSAYFVSVQAFGGTDTVWLAVGSSKIVQPDYSMYIYDTDNTWYYYPRGSSPAMIRLNTQPTNPNGINEKSLNASLFQCMPNPATNSTRISYELKANDNVVVEIYDFLGNKIRSYNEGRKAAGFYNIDVNLNSFASGTYFYTLRTDKNTSTKKMVVVK